ncbi:hypothetical protein, partial [Brachybacterium muris]|uniref:hypothetical protein n=1 Tax=Brachybacterium muris TaxID=219301 RepID=UPI0035E9E02B
IGGPQEQDSVAPTTTNTQLGVRHGIKATVTRMEPETLFVEETPEAREDRTGEHVAVGARYASDRRRDDGEGPAS